MPTFCHHTGGCQHGVLLPKARLPAQGARFPGCQVPRLSAQGAASQGQVASTGCQVPRLPTQGAASQGHRRPFLGPLARRCPPCTLLMCAGAGGCQRQRTQHERRGAAHRRSPRSGDAPWHAPRQFRRRRRRHGPAAASASTGQHVQRRRPRQLLLCGPAGRWACADAADADHA
eukprot:353991-Chlamydomonas_euryale.AAC.2